MDSKGLVLMYHRIADLASDAWGIAVRPETFAQHLESMGRHYEVVALDRAALDLPRGSMPPRWLAVTFDDGYADNLSAAKPLLEKHGVAATVFAVSGKIGSATEFWWDEIEGIFLGPGTLPDVLELSLPDRRRSWDLRRDSLITAEDRPQRPWRAWESGALTMRQQVYREVHSLMVRLLPVQREDLLNQLRTWAGKSSAARPDHRVLNADELRDAAAGGCLAIGCHTLSHTPLFLVQGETLRTEVEASKRDLEHILGRPVTSFSYPFGSYVSETVAAVQTAGYQYACSSLSHEDVCALQPGSIDAVIHHGGPVNLYAVPRVMIEDWEASELMSRLRFWFGD